MKKLTYIISDIEKALPFEWVAGRLRDHFELSYILINDNDTQMESFLHSLEIPVERLPASTSYFNLWRKIARILRRTRPDIVHCHLRKAEIAGIPSSRFAGVKKRVFTRHSSTYNHLYHRKGVVVDKRINALATDVIAISENVKNVLTEMEGLAESKIRLIRHGFDLEEFSNVDGSRVDVLREKYQVGNDKTVIGVIARFTWWKGFEFLVPALQELQNKYQNVHVIFANATGNDFEAINDLISSSIESYTLIDHESDVAALYRLFDVYVHTPIDSSVEAFGQTYIEALASGIPSVFTLSGIANEFISDGYNALTVPFGESSAITEGIVNILENSSLRDELIRNGKKSAEAFHIDKHISELIAFYNE